jgi:hypothetical protein
MIFGVLRSGDSGARTTRKSLRPESVTYVLGTLCYPCLRAGPQGDGGGGGIRTPETLSSLTVFKTAAFNHSATPPQ